MEDFDDLTLADLLSGEPEGDGELPRMDWVDEYDDEDDYVDPELTKPVEDADCK